MNAVDTNVLVYAADSDEPIKQAKAKALLHRLLQLPDETLMLWQVLGEFLNCLRRWETQGRVSSADVERHITDVASAFPLVLPTENIIARSLDLYSRYSLSHWDSMLIAACVEAGVDTLYSEDLSAGMTYDTVTVVDPFKP